MARLTSDCGGGEAAARGKGKGCWSARGGRRAAAFWPIGECWRRACALAEAQPAPKAAGACLSVLETELRVALRAAEVVLPEVALRSEY
eukprot:SAG11_NODE_961_length_6379_cov_141.081529_5_plen_89_part_00